jgi:quercetin dioxygenase-like cupin family protein
MSCFDDVRAIPPQRIWEGVTGRVVYGEQVTLGVIELEPGREVPEHSHENEQVGVLVAGSLTFRADGEERELGPGGVWRILADVPHSVRVGAGGAIVIEAFSPPREDWRKLERQDPAPPRWP